jgi:hypothetical protein
MVPVHGGSGSRLLVNPDTDPDPGIKISTKDLPGPGNSGKPPAIQRGTQLFRKWHFFVVSLVWAMFAFGSESEFYKTVSEPGSTELITGN